MKPKRRSISISGDNLSGGWQLIMDQSGKVIGAVGIVGYVNEMDDECALVGIRGTGFQINPIQYKAE
jgi:uncharacterized protein GlcG (DUF336 family)